MECMQNFRYLGVTSLMLKAVLCKWVAWCSAESLGGRRLRIQDFILALPLTGQRRFPSFRFSFLICTKGLTLLFTVVIKIKFGNTACYLVIK